MCEIIDFLYFVQLFGESVPTIIIESYIGINALFWSQKCLYRLRTSIYFQKFQGHLMAKVNSELSGYETTYWQHTEPIQSGLLT